MTPQENFIISQAEVTVSAFGLYHLFSILNNYNSFELGDCFFTFQNWNILHVDSYTNMFDIYTK